MVEFIGMLILVSFGAFCFALMALGGSYPE